MFIILDGSSMLLLLHESLDCIHLQGSTTVAHCDKWRHARSRATRNKTLPRLTQNVPEIGMRRWSVADMQDSW